MVNLREPVPEPGTVSYAHFIEESAAEGQKVTANAGQISAFTDDDRHSKYPQYVFKSTESPWIVVPNYLRQIPQEADTERFADGKKNRYGQRN